MQLQCINKDFTVQDEFLFERTSHLHSSSFSSVSVPGSFRISCRDLRMSTDVYLHLSVDERRRESHMVPHTYTNTDARHTSLCFANENLFHRCHLLQDCD